MTRAAFTLMAAILWPAAMWPEEPAGPRIDHEDVLILRKPL